MRAQCCICADIFDENNPISAVPCGHVFHSNCLILWLNQGKSCPECRIQLSAKNLIKLYFNFQSNSFLDASSLENEISNCKTRLAEKSIELKELKKETETLRVMFASSEKTIANLQQLVYKYEADISSLRLKMKSASSLESKVLKLETRNIALMNDLEALANIKTIVNGSQKEVDKILQESGSSAESVRQIATYCSVLKRELLKVMDSKSKIQEQNAKLKKENSHYAVLNKLHGGGINISKNIVSELPAAAGSSHNSVSDTNDGVVKISVTEPTIDISPLSVPFNKAKFNVKIGPKNLGGYKLKKNETEFPINLSNYNDENSVVRTGYNGLGGHSNFIKPTAFSLKKSVKRKL